MGRLGEFVKIKGGKRLPKGADFSVGVTSHPYIRARDIGDGKITFTEPVYVDEDVYQKIRNYTVRAGDICITIVGANVGDVGEVPDFLDGANLTENAVKLVDWDSRLNRRFAKYCLMTSRCQEQMQAAAGGAAQPKLGIYKISDLEIPVPSREYQDKCCAILDSIADLIEVNEARVVGLEQLGAHVYREWFLNFKFPNWEKTSFLESSSADVTIPDGWESILLSETLSVIRGRSYSSEELSDSLGEDFVNLKCFKKNGGFRRSGLKKYTGTMSEAQILKAGDTVIAITDMTQDRAVIGRPARIPAGLSQNATFSMDLVKLDLQSPAEASWIYATLKYSAIPDQIKNYANGVNVLHLNPSHILAQRVLRPPKELIEKFHQTFETIFSEIDQLELINGELSKLNKVLMEKLVFEEMDIADFVLADSVFNTKLETSRQGMAL